MTLHKLQRSNLIFIFCCCLGRLENPCRSEVVCNIPCRAASNGWHLQRISPNVITFLHSEINYDADIKSGPFIMVFILEQIKFFLHIIVGTSEGE